MSKQHRYPGAAGDVVWDGALCIHIGECGRAKGDLFVGGRQPWCQPDLVGVEEVAAVIERCPTGALTLERKDGVTETPAAENTIHVSNNGPLYVRGEIALAGAPADAPGLKYRAALCRCGQSKNKPFCDGSHEASGFVDRGAVGDAGPGLEATGGPLEIRGRADGPLVIKGNLTIHAGSGRAAWRGTATALCRCGESKNKPFCDGTHRDIGFQAP